MRAILVNVDRKPGNTERLATAAELATRVNGHVTALIDTPVSRYIAMDPMGGSYVLTEVLDKARADDDAAATDAEAQLLRAGVAFDIIRCDEEPVTAINHAARLSDLVIVSRTGSLAGDIALAARAPVLALNDNTPLQLPIRNACIAWDGSEQAAAALRSAVPLLTGAQSVKLITVIEKAGGFPATDALRYLSRHGIKAEYEEHERRESTEKTLAKAISDSEADLLVMGVYGKSRVREFLFGGVSAHFLNDDNAPALLLAH